MALSFDERATEIWNDAASPPHTQHQQHAFPTAAIAEYATAVADNRLSSLAEAAAEENGNGSLDDISERRPCAAAPATAAAAADDADDDDGAAGHHEIEADHTGAGFGLPPLVLCVDTAAGVVTATSTVAPGPREGHILRVTGCTCAQCGAAAAPMVWDSPTLWERHAYDDGSLRGYERVSVVTADPGCGGRKGPKLREVLSSHGLGFTTERPPVLVQLSSLRARRAKPAAGRQRWVSDSTGGADDSSTDGDDDDPEFVAGTGNAHGNAQGAEQGAEHGSEGDSAGAPAAAGVALAPFGVVVTRGDGTRVAGRAAVEGATARLVVTGCDCGCVWGGSFPTPAIWQKHVLGAESRNYKQVSVANKAGAPTMRLARFLKNRGLEFARGPKTPYLRPKPAEGTGTKGTKRKTGAVTASVAGSPRAQKRTKTDAAPRPLSTPQPPPPPPAASAQTAPPGASAIDITPAEAQHALAEAVGAQAFLRADPATADIEDVADELEVALIHTYGPNLLTFPGDWATPGVLAETEMARSLAVIRALAKGGDATGAKRLRHVYLRCRYAIAAPGATLGAVAERFREQFGDKFGW